MFQLTVNTLYVNIDSDNVNNVELYMKTLKSIIESNNIKKSEIPKQIGWKDSGRMSNYISGAREPKVSDALKIRNALNSMGVKCSVDDLFNHLLDQKEAA